MAKNVAQCMDTMEEVVGVVQEKLDREMDNLKEELQSMNKYFDKLIKLQEDSSCKDSLSTEKAKEDITNSSMMGFIGKWWRYQFLMVVP